MQAGRDDVERDDKEEPARAIPRLLEKQEACPENCSSSILSLCSMSFPDPTLWPYLIDPG